MYVAMLDMPIHSSDRYICAEHFHRSHLLCIYTCKYNIVVMLSESNLCHMQYFSETENPPYSFELA